MGEISVVYGYITGRRRSMDSNLQAIAAFEFDEVYPFTNIFWGGSPAQYDLPVIGIAGSYKALQGDWEEWLWKFAQLLSGLEALDANVNLNGTWGHFSYVLEPKSLLNAPYPDSTKGNEWVITSAPEWDFSYRPDLVEQDPKMWSKFVTRQKPLGK